MKNQKRKSNFHQVGGLVTKYFYFLFIASRALLIRQTEFNIISSRNFITCYSCSYYSSLDYLITFEHRRNNWSYHNTNQKKQNTIIQHRGFQRNDSSQSIKCMKYYFCVLLVSVLCCFMCIFPDEGQNRLA